MKKITQKLSFVIAFVMLLSVPAAALGYSQTDSYHAAADVDTLIGYLDLMINASFDMFPSGSYEIYDSTFGIETIKESRAYVAMVDMGDGTMCISAKGLTTDRTYVFYNEQSFMMAFGLATGYIAKEGYMTHGMTFYFVEDGKATAVSKEEVDDIGNSFREVFGLD